MTGLAEQTMQAYSKLLADTYRVALGQSYDNRHSITWVELDPIARVVLAEMYQADREKAWRESIAGGSTPILTGHDPARRRADDGSAPPILTIFGVHVRHGAAGTGIRWDVGTPSEFAAIAYTGKAEQ